MNAFDAQRGGPALKALSTSVWLLQMVGAVHATSSELSFAPLRRDSDRGLNADGALHRFTAFALPAHSGARHATLTLTRAPSSSKSGR